MVDPGHCDSLGGLFHHLILGDGAGVLGRPVDGSISANRDLTKLALVRLVTPANHVLAGCTAELG